MPKIIVREYDNTKAGVSEYANFSILIPGLVKEREYVASKKAYLYGGKTVYAAALSSVQDKGESIWKEDLKAYPISKQEDFENLIGLVAADSAPIPAVACIPDEADLTFEDDEVSEDSKTAEEKFNECIASLDPHTALYIQKPNSDADNGYLRNPDYKFDGPVYEWQGEAYKNLSFAIIADENKGRDSQELLSYGNQIAYELIGLGYEVLYIGLENAERLLELGEDSFWAPFKDKSTYDFRYILSGITNGNEAVNEAIIKLAHFNNTLPENNGRGDCIALCDIDESCYEGKSQADAILGIQDEINNNSNNLSKYAAYFAPYVVYNVNRAKKPWNIYNNAKFPASFHYLACAAKASEYYNEWYAIAGYSRGICDYSIDYIGSNFGEIAVNTLEPRYNNGIKCAVNIVTKIKGNYYLWGNRTAEELGQEGSDKGDLRASHFLNIRQLCTTIKKQVYVACKQRTFEPNSDLLWIRFCNDIRPTLEKMKADQGITDYKFIKVKTDKKALLVAKIRIVPIEAVEDFDISLTLEDSISGVVAGIDEEEAE
ncbi:MAG: hypothetical protein J6Z11_05590 [Candidatus Riflebacteria bacterium]|nr:hypothetical protein [Candidatus Riflebacteria bacterium]